MSLEKATVGEAIRVAKTTLNRLRHMVGSVPTSTSTPSSSFATEARCEIALQLFAGFHEIYRKIKLDDDDTQSLDELDKAVIEIDELVCYIRTQTLEAKAITKRVPKLDTDQIDFPSISHVRLPPIDLPSFSGDICAFPSFIELFTALIGENKSLSDIERFQYLQTSLKGEALSHIKGLSLTAANYKVALKLLHDRYMNKRLIAQNYLNAIHALKLSSSSRSLRLTVNGFLENYSAFQALMLNVEETQDFLWFDLLLHKVDAKTRERFELTLQNNTEIPTLQSLISFLHTQCRAVEATFQELSVTNTSDSSDKIRKSSRCAFLAKVDSSSLSCPLCQGNHQLFLCQNFLNKSPDGRFIIVKKLKLCLNCLRGNHYTKNCSSSKTCKICSNRHNTLLHFPKREAITKNHVVSNKTHPPQGSDSSNGSESVNTVAVNALTNTTNTTILLSTAMVDVIDAGGHSQTLRVLLDSGSQANFITERCVQRLGLKVSSSNIPIQGLTQMQVLTPKGSTSCIIKPKGLVEPKMQINAVVLKQICGELPAEPISSRNCDHLMNLKLADPSFGKPGHIDLLLGAEVFPSVLLDGKLRGLDESSPIALNTLFGWVLMGKVGSNPPTQYNSFCLTTGLPLNNTITKFWELEEIPGKSVASREDTEAEEIYSSMYARDSSGRFSVPLPFRLENPTFHNSKAIAIRRFLTLERRLMNDPLLHESYVAFMQDYLESGHMQLVDSSINEETSYFIPHHHIHKPDSLTTKLRVVFDASAKSTNGISLNDTLFTGPKLQTDIASILLRFRVHSVVFTADIKRMYRQININQEHRKYQNIIWRFSSSQELSVYQLNTVTYGVSSAPYLALRTILQLTQLENYNFPVAAKVVSTDVYVDDLVTGCSSISEAHVLKEQICALFQSGGFELRKWSSNCETLLADVKDVSTSSLSLDKSSSSSVVKVLGLHWNPNLDCFLFKVEQVDQPCTKRNILSEIARIFDPIGFLAPLTFFAKRLIQHLWSINLDWDDTPPNDVVSRWSQYKAELPLLAACQIPRRLSVDNIDSCQLHGFCDASEAGYAAVIYFRIASGGRVEKFFVCGKTKVAPLRRISVPRLELCAAVLLADLIEFVRTTYQTIWTFDKVVAWSDSTVALSWIKSSPHRWKTFVSNRVTLIQEKVPPHLWYHVPTSDNPADPASRGLLPRDLLGCSLWWAGPAWLLQASETWPQLPSLVDSRSTHEEERQITLVVGIAVDWVDSLLDRFSSLRKIQGVIAYCLRLGQKQNSQKIYRGSLSNVELYKALCRLVACVQNRVFADDLRRLRKGQDSKAPLRRLTPFLDEMGVIRVGGRLRNASIQYDHKHPMLLPRNHRLTDLVIDQFHKENLHPGPQALLFLITQQFWIISGRQAIKRRLSKCYRCFKARPSFVTPIMGDLPAARVSQLKPFSHTGVDFAGPVVTTLSRRRGSRTAKSYICIFVCFCTKALHLEVVSDLSSDAFLASLRRFIARRGRCTDMYSDCGTNFVGANKILCSIAKTSTESLGITWHFNPPSGPHFGGLWEAGVKSVKTHLHRVVGNQILTFEELGTLLAQIEAVLNSRPLSEMSRNPNDLTPLTPGHFLTLEPITAPPNEDLLSLKLNRLSRWQLVQRCHQDFWKRWHFEYLHTLQQRSKWNQTSPNLLVGDLVLIKNNTAPPLQWHLGRIVALTPGPDGVPRVATVRTPNGLIQRPLVKLCRLPVSG